MKKKTKVLRDLIYAPEILFRVNVATAIHAQMAEAAGFKAVGASGSNFSSHVLGLPDAGLTTMTELVENVRRICNAVDIPVIPDTETGFGNAINVRRTTAEIIRAGAAGMFFEDQSFPPRCGFAKGKTLLPTEEAAGKFRAAVDARNEIDPDFVLFARTDARNAVDGSLEEAIKRGKAYKETGVDVIYFEALQSRDEIKAVRDAIDGPVCCSVHMVKPMPSLEELQELGMAVSVGNHFYKSGLVTMWDMLMDMKERGLAPYNEFMDKFKAHPMGGYGPFDITGFPEVVEWERKYLPAEQLEKYNKSFGLYDPEIGHHPAVRRKRDRTPVE